MTQDEKRELGVALLRGRIVNFDSILVKPLTLGEIDEMGFNHYHELINFTLLTKQGIIGRGKEAEKFSSLSLFHLIILAPPLQEMLLEFLHLFILHDEEEGAIRYVPEIETIVVRYKGITGKINSSNFEDFLEFMRFTYHVPKNMKESDRDDIDEEMADLLREFEEAEAKVSKERGGGVTFDGIIEAVSVTHPSVNLFSIWDYTMYQLMRSFIRLDHNTNSTNIMRGLYSGAMSSKDIKLEEYYWAKTLD